jgi:hypothetical protein
VSQSISHGCEAALLSWPFPLRSRCAGCPTNLHPSQPSLCGLCPPRFCGSLIIIFSGDHDAAVREQALWRVQGHAAGTVDTVHVRFGELPPLTSPSSPPQPPPLPPAGTPSPPPPSPPPPAGLEPPLLFFVGESSLGKSFVAQSLAGLRSDGDRLRVFETDSLEDGRLPDRLPDGVDVVVVGGKWREGLGLEELRQRCGDTGRLHVQAHFSRFVESGAGAGEAADGQAQTG